MRKTTTAMAAAIALTMGMMGTAVAADTMLDPFTETKLDTNWEADRQFPSDGVTSVSAFGRDDVAAIGVDSGATASGGFQRTEGIKTVGVQDFGSAVQVDLYLDPAWQDTAARAGLWVAGAENGARNDWFGIIDFISSDECVDCTSHPDNALDRTFQGFRIWDSTVGWTEYLDTAFEYGTWVTLTITLDTATNEFHYAIDGVDVGSAGAGDSEVIGEVFLNSYNYGADEFVTLNSDSYTAHWHVGLDEIDSRDQCKDGYWEEAGFKNQGQCLRFVNTGTDSR